MSEKIERDAFLYLEPHQDDLEEDFAQCGPCRMFVPEKSLPGFTGSRCIIHGSSVEIDEDDSCGFMLPWPTADGKPNAEVVKDHAAELAKMIPGSVTSEESGLVSRRVQCHRCKFPTDAKITTCGLYVTLNKKLPEVFALDPTIKRHACCNAQMPKPATDSKHKWYGK